MIRLNGGGGNALHLGGKRRVGVVQVAVRVVSSYCSERACSNQLLFLLLVVRTTLCQQQLAQVRTLKQLAQAGAAMLQNNTGATTATGLVVDELW